jgi:amidase
MELTDACFAGVVDQLARLRAGTVSSAALVGAYLARIERLDPELNAFRLVFADRARAEASRADERRAAGADAPLLGVPIAVKEDVALAGLPTTEGTDAVDRVAAQDAEMVALLRAAGAVIIGRTRAPELCLWPYTETEFAGATRNPWSLAHSPAGSSGGAAAAVAAGLAAAAIGSDGGGSIRLPSAATGLFGLKPQRDRISQRPDQDVWTGLSVLGPITRTVADAALLMDVLADRGLGAPPMPSPGFADAAGRDPGRLTVAVSLRPWPVGGRVRPAVRRATLATARALADAGHRVLLTSPPLVDPSSMLSYAPRYLRAAGAEAADHVDHPDRLAESTRRIAALGRLIPPTLAEASRHYGQRIADRVNTLFDRVDVLLTPATPRPPLRIGELTNQHWFLALLAAQRYAGFTTLWNLVGNPAAAVPAGFTDDGLPIGVQLVGRPAAETTLLALAGQLERVRPWADRRPPTAG